ncbi:MAG: dTMP kinase [Candidatus Kerfeldbacteria bacterium]|nr:dTMP kinase [Candidatus Kerfeldbacteria bacterium]
MAGKLIIIEGGEGSGKSGVVGQLPARFIKLHEPGDSPVGLKIRRLITETRQFEPHPMTELAMFFADRIELWMTKVYPALERGEDVILDRSYPSTFAHQYYTLMGKRDVDLFMSLVHWFGLVDPALLILLDVPAEIGLQRRRRAGSLNKIDRRKIEYHDSVSRGYRYFVRHLHFPAKIIDARRPKDQVFAAVKRLIIDTTKEPF